MHTPFIRRPAAVLGVLAGLLLVTAPAARADFTWTGGSGDEFWTNALNWDMGVGPGLDVMGMNLIFGPTGMTQSPDAAADLYTNIGGISFTGADSLLTLIGTGSLTLVDGAAITNDSTFLQTINIDLIATGDDLLINSSTANLLIGGDVDLSDTGGVDLTIDGGSSTTISGIISGAGANVIKRGNGVLTLSGINTHAATELQNGSIILGADAALGAGTFTVSGNGTISSSDDSRVVANAVAIAMDRTLSVTGVNDLELSGVISGDGGLLKSGAGTLTLSGANTFTDDTLITGGTLSLTGGSALDDSMTVVISNVLGAELEILADETIAGLTGGGIIGGSVNLIGADLFIAGSGTSSFGGSITGTGGLDLTGDGTVNLTGSSSFSGGTTLSGAGATLGLGTNGALGTGMLNIAADVTIMPMNGNRTITNDVVVLAPQFTIAGSSSLELSGLVDLSALSVTIDVTNTAGVDISGAISNGALTKSGTGTLTLSGLNVYAGDTNVDQGRLIIDGTVSGNVLVNNGGTLSGDGRILQDLTVRSGATMDPGTNGVGRMSITGNYDQRNGSTLLVDVNASNGTSDLLDVTGSATLAGNSTIVATIASSNFIMGGDTFTIIQAAGGVTDNGVAIETTSATMSFILSSASDFENGDILYTLEAFRAEGVFRNAANDGNNRAIGAALDSLVAIANANPQGEAAALLGQLDTFNAANLNVAIDELSSEPFNVAATAGSASSTAFTSTQSSYLAAKRHGSDEIILHAGLQSGLRDGSLAGAAIHPSLLAYAIAAQDRADERAAKVKPVSVYAQGFGNLSRLDTNGNRTGYDVRAYGGQAGLDVRLSPDAVAGLALAFIESDADLNEDSGDLDVETLRAGPYLTLTNDGWYVDVSATFGMSEYMSTRNMPLLDRRAQGDYDGYDITGFVGLGYDWELDNAWTVAPTFSMQYIYFDFDGFTETGAGGANLTMGNRSSDSFRSRIGFAISHRPDHGTAPTFLEIAAGWEHEHLNNDDIDATFAVGGSPFLVDTGPRDENAFYLGLGMSSLMSRKTALFVRYDGLFGQESDSHSITAGASISF